MAKGDLVFVSKRAFTKELVENYKAKTGEKMSVANGIKVLDSLQEVIAQLVVEGHNIRLHGLVDFVGEDQDEKIGKDPRTQTPITVPAKKIVKISKSKKLALDVKNGVARPVVEEIETETVAVDSADAE